MWRIPRLTSCRVKITKNLFNFILNTRITRFNFVVCNLASVTLRLNKNACFESSEASPVCCVVFDHSCFVKIQAGHTVEGFIFLFIYLFYDLFIFYVIDKEIMWYKNLPFLQYSDIFKNICYLPKNDILFPFHLMKLSSLVTLVTLSASLSLILCPSLSLYLPAPRAAMPTCAWLILRIHPRHTPIAPPTICWI